MNKIKILPDTLISQIAAGEVIERPASAVKELLENSLDAGATFCSIEIEQGGMKLIAVRDNGCGMNAEDAVVAFSRHATSKILQLDDLTNIKSYGFRGEALAAIASVSLAVMKTRQHEENIGTEVKFSGGKFESKSSTGCPPGTEIVIRNLFFNTPARKKFLKSEQTETGHIIAVVSHIALANPGVGFELKHNGKVIINTPACAVETRICDILGKDFLSRLIPVSFGTPSINIRGFIGEPGIERSSKRHQYLFINGRDVTDALVSRAILDAYGSRLPARSFPIFVINIDIDPAEVDVNVHPRKLSVKFLDSGRIYRDMAQAVSQALVNFEAGMFKMKEGGKISAPPPLPADYAGQNLIQKAFEFSKDFYEMEKRQEGLNQQQKISFQIISQIADSYILVLEEEGISIVDQHAAHERVLYEKFKTSAVESKPQTQPLLAPIVIECSRGEAVFLKEALVELGKIGFEFDQWSGNSFVMRACPLAMSSTDLEKTFRNFLEDMLSEKIKQTPLPERILKSLACKAAVKFGMKLSLEEQKRLLEELKQTPNSATCPHGRPVRVLLSFEELERRFYRR